MSPLYLVDKEEPNRLMFRGMYRQNWHYIWYTFAMYVKYLYLCMATVAFCHDFHATVLDELETGTGSALLWCVHTMDEG